MDYYKGKDVWFDLHWSGKISDEFAEWWLKHYGHPDLFDDLPDYFVRMAFAYQGWNAANIRVLETIMGAR